MSLSVVYFNEASKARGLWVDSRGDHYFTKDNGVWVPISKVYNIQSTSAWVFRRFEEPTQNGGKYKPIDVRFSYGVMSRRTSLEAEQLARTARNSYFESSKVTSS